MTMTMVQPTVSRVTEIDAVLRHELLHCWVSVSNAGGAVGFVPPVHDADVAPLLDTLLARVAAGVETLVVLRDEIDLLGFAVIAADESPLRRHRAMVKRVQIRPEFQGRGIGALLMAGVHAEARRLGMTLLHLTVRGETGREAFYERFGYREFGRLPRAVEVDPGVYVDEIHLYADL